MTPPVSSLERIVGMADLGNLYLVDEDGRAVSAAIRQAVELAYRWVVSEFPAVDKAQIANWAEAVAASMHRREETIQNPQRFAFAALRGRVKDWFRLRTAKENYVGVDRDLERIGSVTRSFEESAQRKILFDQLLAELPERDRSILVLLLIGKSGAEIAREMHSTDPAVRKAIQRLKQRSADIIDGKNRRRNENTGPGQFCETKG